jgi:hypothetical protein
MPNRPGQKLTAIFNLKYEKMNHVTLCKKDTCVTVKGELANLVAFALVIAFIGYGISALAKALS